MTTTAAQHGVIVAFKDCEYCGVRFYRTPDISTYNFARQRFCSIKCGALGRKPAKRKPRTHCMSGRHAWIPENLYPDRKRNQFKCKLCQQEREAAKRRGREYVAPRPPKPEPVKRQRKQRESKPKQQQPKPAAAPPAPQPTTPPRPVWRPAHFPPVPNTRRSA